MKKINRRTFSITILIKRALEGNVSPLNFVLILGFFSSLVLLYIALHVHCYAVSQDINESSDELEILTDRNAVLTARYNDLVSPDRIIPLAEEMGMRPGTPDEVRRFALYENLEGRPHRAEEWAKAGSNDNRIDRVQVLAVEPEGR